MKLQLELVARAMQSPFNESNAKHEHFTLFWESIIHHTSSIRHLNSHSSLCFLLLLSSSISISISSLLFFAIFIVTLHLFSLTRSHFLLYVIYYSFFSPSFSPSFYSSMTGLKGWRVEGSKDVSRNACWNKSKIAGLLPQCLLSFSTIF